MSDRYHTTEESKAAVVIIVIENARENLFNEIHLKKYLNRDVIANGIKKFEMKTLRTSLAEKSAGE